MYLSNYLLRLMIILKLLNEFKKNNKYKTKIYFQPAFRNFLNLIFRHLKIKLFPLKRKSSE